MRSLLYGSWQTLLLRQRPKHAALKTRAAAARLAEGSAQVLQPLDSSTAALQTAGTLHHHPEGLRLRPLLAAPIDVSPADIGTPLLNQTATFDKMRALCCVKWQGQKAAPGTAGCFWLVESSVHCLRIMHTCSAAGVQLQLQCKYCAIHSQE